MSAQDFWNRRAEGDISDLREGQRLLSTAILGGLDGSPPGINTRLDKLTEKVEGWDEKAATAVATVQRIGAMAAKFFGRALAAVIVFESARLASLWWPHVAAAAAIATHNR